jgi:dTDP-4-dehydrorhamnose 3,5-epimerase
MKIIETPINDLLLIEPCVFSDKRGYFLETFQQERYSENGIQFNFVQDNHSRSKQSVLRGLHFQIKYPQGKLVYVSRGTIFDVAVDIRKNSPSFGQWFGAILSDENHYQLWIPPGFAHGFCVLSAIADFTYKCTDYYHPEQEGGILWNDPDIGIKWPLKYPLVSEKDLSNLAFKEVLIEEFEYFAQS